jgi:hypothetical protein
MVCNMRAELDQDYSIRFPLKNQTQMELPTNDDHGDSLLYSPRNRFGG